jgi:CheY-like chemotaxis protein
VEQPLILLADDNEDNINLILDYLQTQSYATVVARNGQEAMDRAKEEKPDLILMDIQMPGVDGLEATRRLRSDASMSTIPIIAVTALAMPGDRERCLAAGANEYLSKPVNLRRLVQIIETHLNWNRTHREYSR